MPCDREAGEGVVGRAMVVGQKEGKILNAGFPAGGKIGTSRGTVMFWMRPVNWDPGDKLYHVFFEAQGPDARMTIYQFAGDDRLQFLLGPARNEDARGRWQWTQALDSIRTWKRGQWHFVAATWDARSIRLYVDGELKATQAINTRPGSAFERFWIGGGLWGVQAGEDQTLIDEVRIRDDVLTAQAIYSEYQRYSGKAAGSASDVEMALPQGELSPRLDGRIEAGEYSFAATGFMNVLGGLFEHQSRYFLSYDRDRLYVAVTTPVVGALQKGLDITVVQDGTPGRAAGLMAEAEGRDGAVWRDDCVEVYVCPRPETGEYYQFIINSKGAVYDTRGRSITWNCPGLRVANGVSGGAWTMEMAIPFADLGIPTPRAGEQWTFNVCRSFASRSAAVPIATCIAPVKGLYSDIARFAQLTFLERGPVVDLRSIGAVAQGSLDLDLAIERLAAEGCEVGVDLRAGDKSLLTLDRKFEKTATAHIPLQRHGFSGSGKLEIRVLGAAGRTLYRASLPYSTLAPLTFESIYTLIDKQELCLGLKQGRVTYEGKMPVTKVRLVNKAGKVVVEQSFNRADSMEYTVRVDIRSIPVGEYGVEVLYYHPNGQLLATLKDMYTKFPTPAPWMNNKIGVSDEVLPPWTPMTVEGDAVSMWGRTYRFDQRLFPTEIRTQGRSLLAGPIQLVGSENNRAMTAKTLGVTHLEARPNRVRLAAAGAIGSIKVNSTVLAEYDGFVWFDLALKPVGRVSVDRLALEIPLKKESATLVNYRHTLRTYSGRIPEGGWAKDLESHFPVFWVGNEDVGLEWFAETLSGWHVKNGARSAEIIPQGDRVIIRLNLIDSPFSFGKERRISFGLMATPVRPLPAGWRTWRIGEWSRHPYYGKPKQPWSQNVSLWFEPNYSFFNYPEVVKPTLAIVTGSSFEGQSLAEAERRRGRVSVYHSFAESTPFCPEFKWQGKEWIVTSEIGKYAFDQKRNEHVTVDLNSAAYRDFYMWRLKQSIEGNQIHGLYFDFGHLSLSLNPGWTDDEGRVHPVFPVLGGRDLARRIYTLMKGYDPGAIIAYHCSQGEVMAFEAFSDVLYTGEDYVMAIIAQNYRYYNLISLDQFRAQYMARQWGPIPVHHAQFIRSITYFEPQKRPWWDKNGKPFVDHLAGLYLVHDAQYDDTWGFSMFNVEKIKSDFGIDDRTEFLPYWSNGEYVKILSPVSKDIVISMYRKNGKVLVIAFNNTDRDERLRVKFDLGVLRVGRAKDGAPVLEDLIQGGNNALTDGMAEFELKARAYRVMRIE